MAHLKDLIVNGPVRATSKVYSPEFVGDLTGTATKATQDADGNVIDETYLPLKGGKMSGNLEFSNSGTTTRGVIGTVGGNDYWRIVGGATADNDAYLEIATADDGSEPIYVRQYSKGKFETLARTATLLDGSGNTKFPGKVTASSFAGALTGNVTGNVSGSSGSCTGNSATATALTTSAGSATQPVYFSSGKPVACTYTLGKSVPSNAVFTDTVYIHPTSSGNKHIPSGGSSGQILRWSADGTAVWGNDNNTTYSNFVKSGSGAKAGLVPAPSTTAGTTKYLREDGTWAVPPNTTYTSLKNPYTLTIQGNGTTLTNGTYDGSAAKTVNITPSSIGAAASSHTHGLRNSSLGSEIKDTTTDNGWSMIDTNYTNGFILKALRTNKNAPNWIESNYAAGIAFGGGDTKGVLSVAYDAPYIRFAGGNGTKPAWWLRVSGTSGKTYSLDNFSVSGHTHNYAGSSSAGGAATTALACTGNAATATKLKTARTISLTGSVTGSGSFDGSGNLSIATTTNHTHNYLPLSGGTVTGDVTFAEVTSTTYPAKSRGIYWNGSTDGASIYYRVDGKDAGRLVLNLTDDDNTCITFAKGGRDFATIDTSGNYSGNAATATKLKTARTISLTGSVTGSGSFDGSGNLSIATTTNHTHNYLPLAGGTMTGDILCSSSGNYYIGSYSTPFGGAYVKDFVQMNGTNPFISSGIAGDVLHAYSSSSIAYGTLPQYVTDKAIYFGNILASSVYKGDYIELNSYSGWISANTSISIYSDEKVKNFTEDIETDEDKLIKIFDEIILRSYTYKSSKNNSLSIGLSGQELEQLCLDNDIDPEKYNFLNIRYNYRLDNGDGEENTKFYLKFITISYEELYALALLKIKRMEKEHISRLNQSETEIAELKTEMSEVNDKLNEIMTLLNSN